MVARFALAVAVGVVASLAMASPPKGTEGEIIVGITGYGDSREQRDEIMTNGMCNLYVQWGHPSRLMPENLGPWHWHVRRLTPTSTVTRWRYTCLWAMPQSWRLSS